MTFWVSLVKIFDLAGEGGSLKNILGGRGLKDNAN